MPILETIVLIAALFVAMACIGAFFSVASPFDILVVLALIIFIPPLGVLLTAAMVIAGFVSPRRMAVNHSFGRAGWPARVHVPRRTTFTGRYRRY